jgi:hypothetical protein
MMLDTTDLMKRVCDAIMKANERYQNISRGRTLHDDSIEPLISVFIANSLYDAVAARDQRWRVLLEARFDDLEADVPRERGRGQNRAIGTNKRADVALYGPSGLVGVVEIKRRLHSSNLDNDIERIWALLRKSKQMKWGCIAGFHTQWSTTSRNFEERVEDTRRKIERKVGPGFEITKHCLPIKKLTNEIPRPNGKIIGFSAACILIGRKG